MPVFSIIIPCYNSEEFIRENIYSVVNQSFKDFEIIVIDNVSLDNTREIIESFNDKRIQIVSEPDSGIYDAMNKGLSLINGELVHILNSDDKYSSNMVLQNIFDDFRLFDVELIYTGIRYISRSNCEILHTWMPSCYTKLGLFLGWHPPHPGVFVHSKVYRRLGYYDTNYGVTGDYEWLLRVFNKGNARSKLLAQICVEMRSGGASDKDLLTKLSGLKSVYDIHYKVYKSSIFAVLAVILRIATKLIRKLNGSLRTE